MAGLLDPDFVIGGDGPGRIGQPTDGLLASGTPTWADAWQFNTQAAGDWIDKQRTISEERGLWNPDSGLPTGAGLADALRQYSRALLLGTAAPGEPGLTAAIRHNGKVYRATEDNPTHFGALAQVPAEERASAMGDANNRVFVTERGKVLDREKAADYARSFGIYDPGVPPYAKTHHEFIAEWLPGYRDWLRRPVSE